jgi:beta-lactam-binding protein with PASTA domain
MSLASRFGFLRRLVLNGYFWGGLVVLALLGLAFGAVMDKLVMPSVTQYESALTVPDVLGMPYETAAVLLRDAGFSVERETQRFNATAQRDAVVDQTPRAGASVKPGRRVYVTVNSGQVRRVSVPSVVGLSLRDAKSAIIRSGLRVEEEKPDPVPSPYTNAVTRQEPAASDSLTEGSGVVLWYGTGLGDQFVSVPSVTGISVRDAQERLLDANLRSVVVGEQTNGTASVVRQSLAPGSRVREGFEVRLFLTSEEDERRQ